MPEPQSHDASQSSPATQSGPAPQSVKGTRMNPWVVVGLLAAIVAIFALSFTLAPKPSGDDAESFGGTDSVVTGILEDRGVKPWFSPLFEPGSSEVESGLFALQAAIGAGIAGFALGNLRGRAAARRQDDASDAPDAPTEAHR